MSSVEHRVQDYFAAWNALDGERVRACFEPDGTFEDAVTGAPVSGEGIGACVDGFGAAFPDGRLPIDRLDVVGPDRAVVEFRIVGTNTRDSAMGPATGAAVELPAVDLIAFGPSGAIASVRGHWDMVALLGQLGLQPNPSPTSVPGLIEFGQGARVLAGRPGEPGCFTVTSTDADGDDANWVIAQSQRITEDLLGLPGYLGTCFLSAGGRHFTFTAWESPEAVAGLHATAHGEAMRGVLDGSRCTRIMTSLWVPHRLNLTKAGAAGERPLPVGAPEPWL